MHNRVQQEVRGMLKIATVTIAFNQERNDLVVDYRFSSTRSSRRLHCRVYSLELFKEGTHACTGANEEPKK